MGRELHIVVKPSGHYVSPGAISKHGTNKTVLCDGRLLSCIEYDALFHVIGHEFTTPADRAKFNDNFFAVPNMADFEAVPAPRFYNQLRRKK
jgi:microcystin-dependent protein